MFGLFIAICVMIIGAVLLKKRNEARLRADENMLLAVEEMFSHLNVLVDAKNHHDPDVPDELFEMARWMTKCVHIPGIEFSLAKSILDGTINGTSNKPEHRWTQMREPLQTAYKELIHAWFQYISNKNLFARFLIRNGLGRLLEKDDNFSPYNTQVVRRVAKRKNPCPPGHATA